MVNKFKLFKESLDLEDVFQVYKDQMFMYDHIVKYKSNDLYSKTTTSIVSNSFYRVDIINLKRANPVSFELKRDLMMDMIHTYDNLILENDHIDMINFNIDDGYNIVFNIYNKIESSLKDEADRKIHENQLISKYNNILSSVSSILNNNLDKNKYISGGIKGDLDRESWKYKYATHLSYQIKTKERYFRTTLSVEITNPAIIKRVQKKLALIEPDIKKVLGSKAHFEFIEGEPNFSIMWDHEELLEISKSKL